MQLKTSCNHTKTKLSISHETVGGARINTHCASCDEWLGFTYTENKEEILRLKAATPARERN